MDEQEFRRAIMADPKAQTDEIKQAIEQDDAKKQYFEEMQDFEAQIQEAMSVSVPTDLEEKLLSQIRAESKDETKTPPPVVEYANIEAANDNSFWKYAAAACFAFVLGLAINLNSLMPENGVGAGEYALSYTHKNLQNVSYTDEPISLNQVNAQLIEYGVEMQQDIGKVQYANSFFCSVNFANVLHLVVEGETGDINVFVLPKKNNLNDWNEFADGRFNGKATRYSKADVLIVGEKEEPLGAFQSKVENSMKWMI